MAEEVSKKGNFTLLRFLWTIIKTHSVMTKPGTKNIAKFYNTMYSSINYSHGVEYAGLFDIAIFIPIPFFFFFFLFIYLPWGCCKCLQFATYVRTSYSHLFTISMYPSLNKNVFRKVTQQWCWGKNGVLLFNVCHNTTCSQVVWVCVCFFLKKGEPRGLFSGWLLYSLQMRF